jgi:hypothetical protein
VSTVSRALTQPELFTRGLQTCTGKEFGGLAKVHTKDRAAEIAKFLDTHVTKNGHGDRPLTVEMLEAAITKARRSAKAGRLAV